MACDVCGGPAPEGARRCGAACRAFARKHRRMPSHRLALVWAEARALEAARRRPCPFTGKVRHPTKREAVRAARKAERARFRDFRGWLRVYRCEPGCYDWHLTSKPAGDAGK